MSDPTDLVRCPLGRRPTDLGDGLLDFTGKNDPTPARILAWPDAVASRLDAWAEALSAGTAAKDIAGIDDLRAAGVVDDHLRPTALGEALRYHLDEFRWQKGRKGLDGVLSLADFGGAPKVLDVGCGAGQTLRRLEAPPGATLAGIDRDAVALALGARLARAETPRPVLVAGDATKLPFADGTFDLVLTRVAINYMHQATALAEMARVLRPGGTLFCRVENARHDLYGILGSRGPWALLCRLRDFAYGAVHDVAGVQMTPGSVVRGGRAYASARRVGKILRRHGCRVVGATASPNGPVCWGGRTQTIIVGRKG